MEIYKAHTYLNRVDKINVLRETDKSVILETGERVRKQTDTCIYTHTWEVARQFLEDRAADQISRLETELGHYQNVYLRVSDLHDPDVNVVGRDRNKDVSYAGVWSE